MIYPFLSASLPELFAGKAPDITPAAFDEAAGEEMSPQDFRRLLSWDDPAQDRSPALPRVYREMRRFDDYLNWRIALLRAERFGTHADYPAPEEFFSEVDAFLPAAAAAAPAEREIAVDKIRWRKLDDLDAGGGLDFDHLCVYRLKLAMAAKFSRRNRDGKALFQQSAENIIRRFRELNSSSQEK